MLESTESVLNQSSTVLGTTARYVCSMSVISRPCLIAAGRRRPGPAGARRGPVLRPGSPEAEPGRVGWARLQGGGHADSGGAQGAEGTQEEVVAGFFPHRTQDRREEAL